MNMEKIINSLKHLFVPGEKNNYRAKALHQDFLTYYLIFALIFTFVLKKVNIVNVLGFATDITVDKLLTLTNQERSKNNLPALTYNPKLAEAAAKKSQDMFTKNYWAHYAPDGTAPWDFILSSNYHYEYAGENLAKNFLFSGAVVEAWMNSPTHRENILRRDYSEVGFAVVNGILNGEETTLVVQMFGKPLTTGVKTVEAAPPQQSVNETNPGAVPNISQLKPETNKPMINILNISLSSTYVFIFFLCMALFVDFYIASRMNIVHVNGKNLAHFIFLVFMLIGISLIVVKSGIIL